MCSAEQSTRSQLLMRRVTHIEPVDGLTLRRRGSGVSPNEDQQSKQPFLVPSGPEQPGNLTKRQRLILDREQAQHRNANPEEPVTDTVFAGCALEETLDALSP